MLGSMITTGPPDGFFGCGRMHIYDAVTCHGGRRPQFSFEFLFRKHIFGSCGNAFLRPTSAVSTSDKQSGELIRKFNWNVVSVSV